MEKDGIIIRKARSEDWPEFKRIDETGFSGSGFEIITKEQFDSWLNVYPDGFLMAEKDGKVGGYIYYQCCDFDPTNENDNRNFDEMTDFGYSIKTHNIDCHGLYVVSVASVVGGMGKMLIEHGINTAKKMNKKYFSGACRIPSLSGYIKKNNLNLNKREVDNYIELLLSKAKKNMFNKKEIFDPVISTVFKIEGTGCYRNIENFHLDIDSCNWASVLWYKTS